MKDKTYYAQKFKMPEKDIVPEFLPLISLMDDLVTSNDTISNKFKASQKQITFKDKSEAFRFGLGISLLPSFVVLIIASIIFWAWTVQTDFKFKRNYLSLNPKAKEYGVFISNTNLKSDKNGKFIELTVSKQKNARIGKNYSFNKECNCIKVPIYYY
jgi:hypothetical protein